MDPIWRVDGTDHVYSVAVTTERVFLASGERLLALDPADGSIVWTRASRTFAEVHCVSENVVVTTGDDAVVAVDADRGGVVWSFEPPGDYARVASTVPTHDGTVYVGAAQAPSVEVDVDVAYGRLYAFDVHTGNQSFVRDVAAADEPWVVPEYVAAGDTGVFTSLRRGGLVGFDHDGTVRWRRTGDNWYYRPAIADDDGVVVQPRSRSIVALDTQTGELRWRDAGPEMHVAIADGVVYGAGGGGPDEDGQFVALDVTTGRQRWGTRISGCGYGPVVGAETVVLPVGCRDGSTRFSFFGTETGCRYSRQQELTTVFDIGDGRLYASVGTERPDLVAVPLP